MNAQPRRKAFTDADVSISDKHGCRRVVDAAALTICPCCEQAVAVSPLDALLVAHDIEGHAAAILRAAWAGKGLPVMAERIFDAMYADDPDGGPSPTRMYRHLKDGIFLLREKLEGSGVSVESAGYRQGYRLTLRPVL